MLDATVVTDQIPQLHQPTEKAVEATLEAAALAAIPNNDAQIQAVAGKGPVFAKTGTEFQG